MSIDQTSPDISAQDWRDLEFLQKDMQAEHKLIADRINWCLTSQSFLMTAYAISRSWPADPALKWFGAFFFPILGMVISILILFSVWAGVEALALLKREEEALCCGDSPSKKLLRDKYSYARRPGWIHERGMMAARLIPNVFILAWFIALVLGGIRLGGSSEMPAPAPPPLMTNGMNAVSNKAETPMP